MEVGDLADSIFDLHGIRSYSSHGCCKGCIAQSTVGCYTLSHSQEVFALRKPFFPLLFYVLISSSFKENCWDRLNKSVL